MLLWLYVVLLCYCSYNKYWLIDWLIDSAGIWPLKEVVCVCCCYRLKSTWWRLSSWVEWLWFFVSSQGFAWWTAPSSCIALHHKRFFQLNRPFRRAVDQSLILYRCRHCLPTIVKTSSTVSNAHWVYAVLFYRVTTRLWFFAFCVQ